MAIFKNPITGEEFLSKKDFLKSFEDPVVESQLKSLGLTPLQVAFNVRNRLPVDNKFGNCVISGKTTVWNEKAERYERFHSNVEREIYREQFKERMLKKYNKTHLLDEPERQRKMMAGRSIGGVYEFLDGSKKDYLGLQEKKLLEYLDLVLNWPGYDIHCPAPQNFYYKDKDGKDRFYIPDVYIESLNLIVEVKGELHNGYRLRDLHLEKMKDDVLKTSSYNYIKVEDGVYDGLVMKISALKNQEYTKNG